MKRVLFYPVVLLAFFVISFAVAKTSLAQTDTGRLQGTVTDPQGAAVVGTMVTVTNTGTGHVTSVTTNETGFYLATALPPRNYRLEVTQKGFKKTVQELSIFNWTWGT